MKIIIVLVSLCLAGCSSFLYYPTRYKYVDVDLLKHKPEELVYHDDPSKNEKLVGWYFKAPQKKISDKPKALIILFHGNAQNISAHFTSLFWILDEGYDYFIFDYPGYGASYGDPNPKNTKESGELAIEFVRKKWPEIPLIIFGQSLGGAVSLRSVMDMKDRSRICAHVVESTFNSYKKVGQEALASSWLTWILQPLAHVVLSDEYAPKGRISEISPIPLMVIHRKKDSVVPSYLGERIYEEAQEPKKLLLLEGEGHIDALNGFDRVPNRKIFLSFLDKSIQACK